MNYINLTPHDIALNDGRVFKPETNKKGEKLIARVSQEFGEFKDDLCDTSYGDIELAGTTTGFFTYLADHPDTMFIVSNLVLEAARRSMTKFKYKLVAPATGHPDTVRDNCNKIVSVPGFVKA